MDKAIQEVLDIIDNYFSPFYKNYIQTLLIRMPLLVIIFSIIIYFIPIISCIVIITMGLTWSRGLWKHLSAASFAQATDLISLRRRAGWLAVGCWYFAVFSIAIGVGSLQISWPRQLSVLALVVAPILLMVWGACRVGGYPQTEEEQKDIYKQAGILAGVQILAPIFLPIFINIITI
jgi:hypothetical protein